MASSEHLQTIAQSESNFVSRPEVIKLIVGKEKREFLVHKFLFIQNSGYIRNNLASDPSAKVLHELLSDADPMLFGFAVEWLYEHKGKPFKSVPWNGKRPSVTTYCKLWDFAWEELDMIGLQDHVMRQLHAWRMEAPEDLFSELHSGVLQDTTITSNIYHADDGQLAGWITDFCAYQDGFFDCLDNHVPDDYDQTFIYEVLKKYAEGRNTCRHPSDTALKGWKKADPTKEVTHYLHEE